MIKFSILKQSKRSHARLGVLNTPHGEVETPALVGVATQATVKTLTSDEVKHAGSQILIANTFHLHLRPGEKIVKSAGGLHQFMRWDSPLMTDSGGFQVFSLGFGRDLGISKIAHHAGGSKIQHGKQPQHLKITDHGVTFRSPIDGRKIFLGPRESIRIQESLGADIIFAFDECPPPHATRAYMEQSLARTHAWAKQCLDVRCSKQALYGIVQGGGYKDLREQSAKFISALPFDGFGIGGEFGANKKDMEAMLGIVNSVLPRVLPRHLLGVGHPDDLLPIIRAGVDTFDCTVPTHYARHGIAFTSRGRLDLNKIKFLREHKPLDSDCDCFVCTTYTRSYITHLLRAREITPLRLLTFHNLYYFNNLVKNIRDQISKGKI